MNFYMEIAPFYDDLFPLDERKNKFFRDLFVANNAQTVLDLGCGTGSLANALANEGFSVIGIDSSEGLVAVGMANATGNAQISFIVSEMNALSLRESHAFDAIICIGNSLPHLRSKEEVRKALDAWTKLIREKGLLVIQMLNFKRLHEIGCVELPELTAPPRDGNAGLSLRRVYQWSDGYAIFKPEVVRRASARGFAIPMTAVSHDELWSILEECGIASCGTYENFSMKEWSESSTSFVTVGRKMREPLANR
ncbi:MAG: methyltransferase domain-containing protein [Candidatus Latescibacteria bacterium]|nr:methyltransferase domain-containing protein [Candidatus Latescibacterota bacterium]NIM66361.1 methyltransferase domain-containing protein [Candidatus Latescibacterota bacterium]NIO02840.1 methyltransferase domain-containing protein [Candidatus Latescibacterota bacterium]NIO29975.1 methyltransferase domain-containing protein [Candidatus Latescibacterota bacterium]NIO57590.1 methyltransferase domain-containing protein [Candidatus Latescibacterota bacterium]